MRHGIPIAGNFLQQELADPDRARRRDAGGCAMRFPGLAELQKCFHTKVVSTSPKAHFPGTVHIEFHEEEAMETAKEIVRIGDRELHPSRSGQGAHPQGGKRMVAGFTTEVVFQILGGKYRPSYRPLNDGIQTGRLRGVAGVVGCNNPKQVHDECHLAMVRELIRNDVLVVQTGCTRDRLRKGRPADARGRRAARRARGWTEICRAVGIPPVLARRRCVDNSRILPPASKWSRRGASAIRSTNSPVAGAAPEWMSEKAIAIGMYFVASGIFVVIGQSLPVEGSRHVVDLLTQEIRRRTLAPRWAFEPDPIKAAHLMIDHIDRKRADLGLPLPMYPVPYVPKTADAVVAAG